MKLSDIFAIFSVLIASTVFPLFCLVQNLNPTAALNIPFHITIWVICVIGCALAVAKILTKAD